MASIILKFSLRLPYIRDFRSGIYHVVRTFSKKEDKENALRILQQGFYHHTFSDNSTANIMVEQIDSRTAASCRKKSKGFCGYDWMVNSIIKHGEIKTN